MTKKFQKTLFGSNFKSFLPILRNFFSGKSKQKNKKKKKIRFLLLRTFHKKLTYRFGEKVVTEVRTDRTTGNHEFTGTALP